ncbi:MAG: glycosyltransferase family 2 protein [Lachnospiraceae bacterium]|nr:glycosyltransferase family 2 protein [Lachnospiraceae bacterium]
MEIKPVIIAIGYNRLDSLGRLLDALENAYYEDEVLLVISIDYGGDDKVTELAREFVWTHGEKLVKTYSGNLGLRKHIIQCADLSMEYGAAIIFEDDIIPSPYFYKYVKQAVNFYKDDERVFAVSLYSQVWNGYSNRVFVPLKNEYDAFISQIECSWGECFIGERWKEFKEWYRQKEENLPYDYNVPHAVYEWENSRSKYLLYYIVEKGKYYLTPYDSLSTNFHSVGVHVSRASSSFQVPLFYGDKEFNFPQFENALKYDAFFESVDLKSRLEKEHPGCKICIDYYGLHRDYASYDLCFSSADLPYRIVKSYGLELRPPELNYYYDVKGEDLFLYDISVSEKHKRRRQHHYNMLHYDVKDLQWVDSLFYTLYEWWLKLKKSLWKISCK